MGLHSEGHVVKIATILPQSPSLHVDMSRQLNGGLDSVVNFVQVVITCYLHMPIGVLRIYRLLFVFLFFCLSAGF